MCERRPHDNFTTTTVTTTTHTTPTTKKLALWRLILDESSPSVVPARTPTVHWRTSRRQALGGPIYSQRAKLRPMTHFKNTSTDRSSDKHGSGARDDQPAGAEYCRGTAGADRGTRHQRPSRVDGSEPIEQLNTAATKSTAQHTRED